MPKLARFRMLLALALLGAPRLLAVEGYIEPWCNWQTGEIEIYQVPAIDLSPYQFQIDPSISIGPFLKIGFAPWSLPKKIPDYDKAKKIQSPLNGKDCRYAQGKFQLGHPYEMSDPIANKLITGKFIAAAADNVSLVNTFPNVVPLPLSLPSAFTIPDQAAGGSCDGTLGLYQVENDLDTVTHVSVCPPRNLRDIHVCSSPLSAAVTPDASTLLVTCYNNAVAFIDTATDTVKFTLSTPNAFPAGIAISPDGTKAYVTNYYDFSPNPALLVIDINTHAILNTIPLPTAYPGAVALTPDGTQAWVNYYQSTGVDIVDLASGAVGRHISLGEVTQNGMAFNPTGTKAFIATGSNHLAIIDTGSLNILTKLNVASTPLDVVVSPDGSRVLVGSYSNGVISVVDAVNNVLVQNMDVPGPMQGLQFISGSLPF